MSPGGIRGQEVEGIRNSGERRRLLQWGRSVPIGIAAQRKRERERGRVGVGVVEASRGHNRQNKTQTHTFFTY